MLLPDTFSAGTPASIRTAVCPVAGRDRWLTKVTLIVTGVYEAPQTMVGVTLMFATKRSLPAKAWSRKLTSLAWNLPSIVGSSCAFWKSLSSAYLRSLTKTC